MFAFALYDQSCRKLHLVRDRMGEKPLYYGFSQGVFLFGSELKALRAHPAFEGEINRDALQSLLTYQYCIGQQSIYSNFFRLKPGSILTLDIQSLDSLHHHYWDLHEVAKRGFKNRLSLSDDDAVDHFEQLLKNSVSLQMMADVPVGAFLSGGVDSSLIVAMMQSQASRPVKSFTIGFEDDVHNEAPFARAVARHLGTDHTEYVISPREALDVIPLLPSLYDEPLADVSQIPTFLG